MNATKPHWWFVNIVSGNWLRQGWPTPLSPYGVTKPQWVNRYSNKSASYSNVFFVYFVLALVAKCSRYFHNANSNSVKCENSTIKNGIWKSLLQLDFAYLITVALISFNRNIPYTCIMQMKLPPHNISNTIRKCYIWLNRMNGTQTRWLLSSYNLDYTHV